MKKKRIWLKIRNFISSVLVILILLSTSTFRIFATEGDFVQNVVKNDNSILAEEEVNNDENQNGSTQEQEGVDEQSLDNQEIEENSLNDNESEDDLGTLQNNALETRALQEDSLSISEEEQTTSTQSNDSVETKSTESAITTSTSEEGFKIALRWGGTSSKNYTWNAEEKEDRVIKLTFYYQNEVANKEYLPGDLQVTIPGIGNLNRDSTKKVTDIAADEYGVAEIKRDWSYKYDAKTDTYTFYNNKKIEKGSTFNGSFEMLWEFSSRDCVNGYTQKLQATLKDGSEIVVSPELSLEYTSTRDTFYIEKSAKSVTSADGLNRFVEVGKTVSDYAWIQYTYRYSVEELNARGLQSRYFIDTFPKGCVIAKDSNVIKNEDGTSSYKIEEKTVGENTTMEHSVIIGYPDTYSGKLIKSVVDLYGTYKEEEEEEKLATGETEVKFKNVHDQWIYFSHVINTNKTMDPDYVYRDDLEGDINFSTKIKSTTTISPINPIEYGIAITDDFLQIYTDKCYRLKDDEYEFTSVTVPGKNNFYNANGYEISDGDYTVKIKVLYRDDVNKRGIDEYTTIYEGKWGNQSITKKIENAVAVRAEISGLTESITSFYITANGTINVSDSGYEMPTYIRNCNFTDLLDKNGNSLISGITEESYAELSIYEEDMVIYGKGLLRSSDTMKILENQVMPGYYNSYAEINPFEVDKQIENFVTKQTHAVEVNNTQEEEIEKIKIYGVNEKEELETLIETLKFTYKNLEFQKYLSNDVDMQDYLRERASIEKNGKEIVVAFDFSDNPIISTSFSIGYTVESNLSYEKYYDETKPIYTVKTYAILEDSNLESKSTSSYKGKTMAYDSDTTNILLALASHQQLIKAVKTEYTNGEFVEEGAVVPLNTEYTYRLKLRNGYNTLVNTEFIEILEHAELTKVNEEYPYNKSEWYGKLKNVDTTYLEEKGLSAKVYYTNTLEPNDNSWTLMESYSAGIWKTENEVVAIKVEVEGEILENSIIHVDVNMVAPNDESLVDKYAYNTYTINSEAIDLYTGVKTSVMQNMPSNVAEVRLTKKEYNLEISKIDEVNKNKLSGVQFGIYDEEGNKIRTNLTGILGDTTVKALKEGTYTIKEEITPLGYEKSEDYTLTIENGNYTLKQGEEIKAQGTADLENNIPKIKITIENSRAKGSITVYKIDEYLDQKQEEIPLQGVEFELLDTQENIITTGTTDENGNVVFENIDWGKTYIIKEKEAPQGYKQTIENTYLSKLNKDKIVRIKNIRKAGTVTLTKEDEIDGTKLEGAKYGVYAENDIYNKKGEIRYEKDTLIREGTTNEEGQVTFTELAWGEYYLKEIETVYGYEISEEKHLFTINAETVESSIQKTEKEKRSKAILGLVKTDDSEKFLSGAEFALFDENGNKIQEGILTDENGQLNIEGIEWGDFYIQETKAPEGYEENDTKYYFTVNRETFSKGSKVVSSVKPEKKVETTETTKETAQEEISIIKNNKKKGKVTLTKYACNASGEETTDILQGAVYELYLADGTKIGEYTSDENGKITVEDLDWGSYYFQETVAPESYSISDKKISFVVNSKNADFEQELKAYNKQESGEIKINKKIKANILEEGHGNATFIFKIVGRDENDEEKVTLYRTITFSSSDKEVVDAEGEITKSIIISDIEPYKYEITEEENFRYELGSIIPVINAEVNNKTGIINLLGAENKGEITFANEKVNNSLLTDAQVMANMTQSEYYLIGISAKPKQESYSIGTKITGSDFTFTLYYSGGQEVETDLTEGITFNGESEYTQDLEGSYITNIEYTVNGKTFETETTTKWVMPGDYFTYTINSTKKTMTITGVNEKYLSPSVLYIPSEYNGYKVGKIGVDYRTLTNIENVKNVIIEKGVTSISKAAFKGCRNLTSIEIPEGVTSIGECAFWACSNLTSVKIPEEITSIAAETFRDCTSLVEIEIPEGVTSIGGKAFSGCSSLTNVKIPDSVTSIGWGAFGGCGSFTKIEIPNSVTSIGGSAFANCIRLKEIEIPDGVTSIGDATFLGCNSLTEIEIPEGVTSIGSQAFRGCSSLTNINIPERVTSIGSWAFYLCSRLTEIEIPEGVTSIGGHTFDTCIRLKSIKIPSTVTSIGEYAFNKCTSLTEIEIPEGVTSIGKYAFNGCTSLAEIEIPEGVISIEEMAFAGCNSLTSIEIPNSVTSIGRVAFYNCSSLTSVKISSNVTSIGDGPFKACRSLTNIEVSEDNQKYVSIDGVLYNKEKTEIIQYPCKKVGSSYVILEGVTSIGNSAFTSCYNLTSIEIPSTVVNIGNYVFHYCNNLTSIEIPEGVTNIGTNAFTGCGKLTEIEIPSSVITIGEGAFSECSSLTKINVVQENENYVSVDEILFNKNMTELIQYPAKKDGTEYIIPSTVTSIEYSAFRNCTKLTNINIPEGVTSIGKYTFAGCSNLTSIEIPTSVTNIDGQVFYKCSSLTSIDLSSSVTSIGYQAFSGCSQLTTINYHGTPEQFNAITIGNDNNYFKNATVNYIQD